MDKASQRPEAGRGEIVEAAERLLQARGAQVRAQDVVREAGVGEAAFRRAFPTWDDLLEAVRRRMARAFEAAHPLPTEVAGPVDWPAVVDAQAAAFIAFSLARRGIGEAAFHPPAAPCRSTAHRAIGGLTAMIRAGQEAEAFGPVDPEPTARLLFAALHEAADAVAGGADRGAMLAALQGLLRRTLEA